MRIGRSAIRYVNDVAMISIVILLMLMMDIAMLVVVL